MKIKKLLVLVTTFSLFATLSTGSYLIHAEDDDTSDGYTESGEEIQELVPDYDTSGYEAWLPDYNPRTREMHGGYNRQGNFIVCVPGTGSVQTGTAIKSGNWTSNGYPVLVYTNGNWVQKSRSLIVREYVDVSGTFELKRNCTEFKAPIADNSYRTGGTLPAGTYQVRKEAMEFLELVKPDGNAVWVSPQYVTIHNTANEGYGANAASHATGQKNANSLNGNSAKSWHYTVDNKEIYQSMPMNEVAYHAGDGQFIGNAATIGIEICENSDGNYAQAEKNAAYLTAQLLYENGLPSDAVRMHRDWSGKNCPHNVIENTKGTMGWDAFKSLVKQEYDRLMSENTINTTIPNAFIDIMTNSKYKFESGFVSGLTLDSSLNSIQEKLKSLDSSVSVEFKKGNSVIGAETKISTGQQVIVTKGSETFRFALVIKGDTNGDGQILANDYFIIKKYKENSYSLSGAYLKASDINNDGKILANDYFMIKKYKEGSYSITQ